MKKNYNSPFIEIKKFHVEDIITASDVTSEGSSTTTTEAVPLPVAEIPPVLDSNDVFYN